MVTSDIWSAITWNNDSDLLGKISEQWVAVAKRQIQFWYKRKLSNKLYCLKVEYIVLEGSAP